MYIIKAFIVIVTISLNLCCISLPQRTTHDSSSIIGLRVYNYGFNSYLYFAKLENSQDVSNPIKIIQSDYVYGENHYLFNVENGIYAIVIAFAEEWPRLPFSINRVFLYPKEMIIASIVEIKKESFYYMGDFSIKVDLLTPARKEPLKNIDLIQKYYYELALSNKYLKVKVDKERSLDFFYDAKLQSFNNKSEKDEIGFLTDSIEIFENKPQCLILKKRKQEILNSKLKLN